MCVFMIPVLDPTGKAPWNLCVEAIGVDGDRMHSLRSDILGPAWGAYTA